MDLISFIYQHIAGGRGHRLVTSRENVSLQLQNKEDLMFSPPHRGIGYRSKEDMAKDATKRRHIQTFFFYNRLTKDSCSRLRLRLTSNYVYKCYEPLSALGPLDVSQAIYPTERQSCSACRFHSAPIHGKFRLTPPTPTERYPK